MSLERIEITPFALIAGDILQHRRSGSLTILKPPLRKVLYWSHGELVMAASAAPEDSLPNFLVHRRVIAPESVQQMFGDDAVDVVGKLHESGLLDLSARQTLLREWLASQFIPLFSLDEGTAAFAEDEPLTPEKRIFVQSTAALVIEGIRAITNGLVLRRSLGEMTRDIEMARESRFRIEALPLVEAEREIAASLTHPTTVDAFLKRFAAKSAIVGKVVVMMLALGVYRVVEHRAGAGSENFDETLRDLELLAAIGANDPRSLRAVGYSKQLATLDHYQVLDVPRAATRAQIVTAAESLRRNYDPKTYPPILQSIIEAIRQRIDVAVNTLRDSTQRASYDKLLHASGGEGETLQQRLTQRSIAEENFTRARGLMAQNDFYGAILLFKQTLKFMPEHSEAWMFLGACQERNPKWRRVATESFQMALSIDPNNVEALISLGDLYKAEGLISRAQTCYEDVVKIAPDNAEAKSRLQALKKR